MRSLLYLILVALGVLLFPATHNQTSDACETSDGANRFGVVENLTWRFLYAPEDIERAMDMMVEAGIGWVRLNWSWKDFQPVDGAFQFEQFDLVAASAAEHDIQLLPILTAVPAWASTAPAELIAERGNLSPVDRYRPRDIETWRLYVRTVVERYDGDGVDDAPGSPRLSHWEVWNEPNLALFWPPQPDVDEYLSLLAITYADVMAADPTATVVLGGLSGNGVREDGSGYLQAIYEAGGAAYFDVVSVHLYSHPASTSVEGINNALIAAREVLDANGDEDVPIWLTEIGWSDTPNAWAQPTASHDEIASFLGQLYAYPLEAEIVFWYNFRNVEDDSPDVEHNFGLVNNDFTPKAAYEAYTEATADCRA